MSSRAKHNARVLTQAKTLRFSTSVTDGFIRDFLSSIDSPRSLTVWLLYSSKEHDQLTALDIDPGHYCDPDQFRDDYHATCFLSKANFLKTTFDKKKAALKKFQDAEDLCRATNRRFSNLRLDPLFHGPNVWLLNATRRKIDWLLGDFVGDELVDSANWGPGVTTFLKGDHVSAVNKFHLENGLTSEAYPLVSEIFNSAYPIWGSHLDFLRGKNGRFTHVDGNKVVTVPKNSKTDRPIAVEPGLNLWFQKAIGSMIRRRLRRNGVDLNNQSRNQQLSKIGLTADLATVDFSSASDTIASSVVEELLPPRWFRLLNLFRSHRGSIDCTIFTWNKFSSMGNGYTFELESLIFYSAALAVCEYLQLSTRDVSVYGDDVIIPCGAFDLFSSFSEFLGFRVNPEKSFSSGLFRESCGAHFFDGVDVKPYFLKERIRDVQAVFRVANGVRLLAHRNLACLGCDRRYLVTYRHLLSRLPRDIRIRVDRSLGDVGLISNFDEAVPSRAKHGLEGFVCRSLTTTSVVDHLDSPAVLLARLWVPSMQSFGNSYDLRGRVRLRIVDAVVPRWYNLGPWI